MISNPLMSKLEGSSVFFPEDVEESMSWFSSLLPELPHATFLQCMFQEVKLLSPILD